MKGLKRNMQKFFYAEPTGDRKPILDANGNMTGEYASMYSEAKEWEGNISPATGAVEAAAFGSDVTYDRVIVLAGNYPPIDEFYKVWFDGEPYIVKKVAPSLNSVSIAIRKVNVRG